MKANSYQNKSNMKRTMLVQFGLLLALVFLSGCFGGLGASPSTPPSQSQVRETLERMTDAYQAKNIKGFMAFVSDGYRGEAAVLDSAIRRDFSDATNIGIRYNLGNVTFDGKDLVSATVSFTREHTAVSSGNQVVNSGESTMVFRMENGGLRLYSMGKPAMFSLN
jgi:hypothetical protein